MKKTKKPPYVPESASQMLCDIVGIPMDAVIYDASSNDLTDEQYAVIKQLLEWQTDQYRFKGGDRHGVHPIMGYQNVLFATPNGEELLTLTFISKNPSNTRLQKQMLKIVHDLFPSVAATDCMYVYVDYAAIV